MKHYICVKNIEDKYIIQTEVLKKDIMALDNSPTKHFIAELSQEEYTKLLKDDRIKYIESLCPDIEHIRVTTTVPNFQDTWTGNLDAVITNMPTGQNVDVVICDDGIFQNDHPEFASNPDGTGGSRVNLYNWYVNPNNNIGLLYDLDNRRLSGNYSYTTGTGRIINNADNGGSLASHGTHVAGTAAGNTQGWAKKANIYFMHFGEDYRGTYNSYNIDNDLPLFLIQSFHNNKPTINRNPTIVNCSWANMIRLNIFNSNPDLITDLPLNRVTSIRFRGNVTVFPNYGFDIELYYNMLFGANGTEGIYGRGVRNVMRRRPIPNNPAFYDYISLPASYILINPNTGEQILESGNFRLRDRIEDMINDGIVIVSSAGNESLMSVETPENTENQALDYNNYIEFAIGTNRARVFYNRPFFPAGASISVGAMGVGGNDEASVGYNGTLEHKASYSNCGSDVDIYAPGSKIISSVRSDDTNACAATDPRNSNFRLGFQSGTSMASPQVVGALACFAENNRDINQASALSFLIGNARKDRLYDRRIPISEDLTDSFSLQGGQNRYLFYPGGNVSY